MKNVAKLILVFLLWMLGSWIAPAQTVNVPPIPAATSVHGQPMYFQSYVANLMDYGFVWLDSGNLTAGYINALGKCAIPNMMPASNLWTALDCNGLGTIGYDFSGVVVLNNLNGQCKILNRGTCQGPRNPGSKDAFGFVPGTWGYVSAWNTQVFTQPGGPDPQGRFWNLSCTPPGFGNTVCTWTVSGGATPTPAPTVTGGPTWSPTPHASATPALRSPTPAPTRTWTPGGPCVPVYLPDGRCVCQGTSTLCPVTTPTPPPQARTATVVPPSPTRSPEVTATPTPKRTPTSANSPVATQTFTNTPYPRMTVIPVKTKTPPSGAGGLGQSPGLWVAIGAFVAGAIAAVRKFWQRMKEKYGK